MWGWVENIRIIFNMLKSFFTNKPILKHLLFSAVCRPLKMLLEPPIKDHRNSAAKGTIATPTHLISAERPSPSSPYLFAESQESNWVCLSPQAARPIHTAGPERANTRWQSSQARFGQECKIPTLFIFLSVTKLQDWCFLQQWLQLEPYPFSETCLKQHPGYTLHFFSCHWVAWRET